MSVAGLVARRGQDCATRVRIVYRATRAITLDDADFLPGAARTISEFSLFVEGARDHVKLTLPHVEASYAIDNDELVVAYGKLGGKVPHGLVEAVEHRLETHFGPIVAAKPRSEVPPSEPRC